MKVKLVIAAVVVLLLALILLGGKKPTPPADAIINAAATTDTAKTKTPEPPGPTPTPTIPQRPAMDKILEISVGTGDAALRLERADGDWDVVGAASAPADEDKVDKFLAKLLTAEAQPLPENAERTGPTGLENGGGLPVKLVAADHETFEMRVGLRPEGSYHSTYVRFPGDVDAVLAADLRGSLGIWKNTPDAMPDPAAWLEKEALSFNPADAVRLEAVYPDHRIVFEKPENGAWEQRGYVPGGEWDRDALNAWLRDLSQLRISGLGDNRDQPKESQKLHEIKITLADGGEKFVRVAANLAGEGMLAESSDHPGHVFHLPEWRFRKYFRRFSTLFPKAVPRFDIADIRFIDVRQGGETVKIANRDNAWQATTAVYPLRPDIVERLARMLSSWRPEDYAAPDFKTIHPMFAGPMVEVILAGGAVHQYRLAGRHPLFAWRYVVVDNSAIFSVTDAEADVMFPDLAEVLELGPVLPMASRDDIQTIRLEGRGDVGEPLFLHRKENGIWCAEAHDREIELTPEESEYILDEMLGWSVAGFYNIDARPGKQPNTLLYHLTVTGKDAAEQNIQFLEPDERDVPYILEGQRAYLLDRRKFFNWLGAVRGLGNRIHAEKILRAAEAEKAEKAEKAEQAEKEKAEKEQAEAQSAAEEATADHADAPEEKAGEETPASEAVDPHAEETPPLDVEEVASGSESAEESPVPEEAVHEESATGVHEEEQTDPVADEAVEPAEPPVDIPPGDPAHAQDEDLVQPPLPSEFDVDMFSEEGKPVIDAMLERFARKYARDDGEELEMNEEEEGEVEEDFEENE